MSGKLSFASGQWLDMLEARWREFGARVTPGERFSISETYTNVPAAMSRSGDGRVAWTCRLNAPSVHFERSASTDVDLYMEADYEAIIALVRFVVTPDNQNEYQRVAQQAMADHRIRTVGDLGRAAFAQELHNEVAERTC